METVITEKLSKRQISGFLRRHFNKEKIIDIREENSDLDLIRNEIDEDEVSLTSTQNIMMCRDAEERVDNFFLCQKMKELLTNQLGEKGCEILEKFFYGFGCNDNSKSHNTVKAIAEEFGITIDLVILTLRRAKKIILASKETLKEYYS